MLHLLLEIYLLSVKRGRKNQTEYWHKLLNILVKKSNKREDFEIPGEYSAFLKIWAFKALCAESVDLSYSFKIHNVLFKMSFEIFSSLLQTSKLLLLLFDNLLPHSMPVAL